MNIKSMTIKFAIIAIASIATSDKLISFNTKTNNLYINWEGDGVLQSSTNLLTWKDIRSAINGQEISTEIDHNYYRLRQHDYSLHSNYSNNTDVALIDYDKNLVHLWSNNFPMATSVYLQDDGSIIKSGRLPNVSFTAGGVGGNIQKLDWNSNLIWNFDYSSETNCLHHDIEILPNGNILAIAWEILSEETALALGRNPAYLNSNAYNVVWSESIIELQPDGTNDPIIVWRWNVHDHLIQDFDNTKDNYGVVSEHPELINFNYPYDDDPDWLHFNGIDYNEELDQILVSSRHFHEIWVIDHSTTPQEAATNTGGRSGKGGNILYRYGNPQAYNRGNTADQKLGGPHNPTWIPKGYLGEGNILIFNNGTHRGYSSVDEIKPPLLDGGSYDIMQNQAFGPTNTTWTYDGQPSNTFYAAFVSGAQRLHNGNTLVTLGPIRRYFEVNQDKNIVWDHTENGTGIIFKSERYFFDIPK